MRTLRLRTDRNTTPSLGAANLALLSLYFAPIFGTDALRALLSPYRGLEDRLQAAAATYVGGLFDVTLDGLTRASAVLAGVKLVVAAGFLAYLIEFARAAIMGRTVDRSTLDVVLLMAVGAVAVWVLPSLAVADGALIRVCASQLVLVAGAVVVITIERQIEQSAQPHVVSAAPTQGDQVSASSAAARA
jgi:hypothetical protein